MLGSLIGKMVASVPSATHAPPTDYPSLLYYLRGDGLAESGGNVTSWVPTQGTGTLSPTAGTVTYVASWRNSKAAALPTATRAGNGGRLQNNTSPTAASPSRTYLYALQIPDDLVSGDYVGSSHYSGKPFPFWFHNASGVITVGTSRDSGANIEFATDLAAHAGKDAVFVLRHVNADWRVSAYIEGGTLYTEALATAGATVTGTGIAIGGWADSGGGFPYAVGGFAIFNAGLTDDEMDDLALWGAEEWAL